MIDELLDLSRARVLITGVSGQQDAKYFEVSLRKIPKTLRHRCHPDLYCCASKIAHLRRPPHAS